jgi:glycolate oxidase
MNGDGGGAVTGQWLSLSTGTVTGEHGVGILKRDGMRRELDPGSLALQSAVRRTLDPREIFNPGKG